MTNKIEKAVLKSLRQAAAIRDAMEEPAKAYTLSRVRRLSAKSAPVFTSADSGITGHPFRFNSATHSGGMRPARPGHFGQ